MSGFRIEYLLDLPVTSLDNLFKSTFRARRRILAEEGRTTMYAAQGEPKHLEEWLSALIGDPVEKKSEQEVGNADQLIRDFFGKSGVN